MFIVLLCLSIYIYIIDPNVVRCELSGLTQRDLFRLGASQIQPWSRRMTQNSTPIQYPICPPNPQTRIIRSSVPLSRRSPSPEQANHTNSMATCVGPPSRRTPSPGQAERIEGQDPLPIYIDQPPVRSPSPSPAENVTYDDPPPIYIASPPSYEDCVSQK
ncbi:hypothetical protein WR25_16239 isoform B [Diploscapter pachys]|uniref:Uncharacterized protein n=1 Tax=Diploscapter pachys TaxID=2018661 RepID=A0A2A2KNN2_9BILA|nr:hypothetical protein WR25_16239 isoform A [Diploscapter pachys]PAV75488.1 hypothetical protein WR25_16239 isoform B [Diploscapter pachys]